MKISKDVIIVKKPHIVYNELDCYKFPSQFSCDMKPDAIIGREFTEQSKSKLEKYSIEVVTDMNRQIIKDNEIYNFKTYQIVNFSNLSDDEIKEIAKICDESWRI